eukprot:631286-Rhodomonas_salina.1
MSRMAQGMIPTPRSGPPSPLGQHMPPDIRSTDVRTARRKAKALHNRGMLPLPIASSSVHCRHPALCLGCFTPPKLSFSRRCFTKSRSVSLRTKD